MRDRLPEVETVEGTGDSFRRFQSWLIGFVTDPGFVDSPDRQIF